MRIHLSWNSRIVRAGLSLRLLNDSFSIFQSIILPYSDYKTYVTILAQVGGCLLRFNIHPWHPRLAMAQSYLVSLVGGVASAVLGDHGWRGSLELWDHGRRRRGRGQGRCGTGKEERDKSEIVLHCCGLVGCLEIERCLRDGLKRTPGASWGFI